MEHLDGLIELGVPGISVHAKGSVGAIVILDFNVRGLTLRTEERMYVKQRDVVRASINLLSLWEELNADPILPFTTVIHGQVHVRSQ